MCVGGGGLVVRGAGGAGLTIHGGLFGGPLPPVFWKGMDCLFVTAGARGLFGMKQSAAMRPCGMQARVLTGNATPGLLSVLDCYLYFMPFCVYDRGLAMWG